MNNKDAKNKPMFKTNAETGLSKRPQHPDFMVSSELKRIEFSGVRPNNERQIWEFWILGKIEKEVGYLTVHLDPSALSRAHVELFGLIPDEEVFKRDMARDLEKLPEGAIKQEGRFFDDSSKS